LCEGNPLEQFARRLEGFPEGEAPAVRRRWIAGQLVAPFVVEAEEDFWAWHYTFISKRTERAMKLIGEDRAESIAFNALLPILLVHARERRDRSLEQRVWQALRCFPALESNAITRHMRLRLFGESDRGHTLFHSEARQQALFQIFAECCNLNEVSCEDCFYYQSNLQQSQRPFS
jgi:hypothetical protein